MSYRPGDTVAGRQFHTSVAGGRKFLRNRTVRYQLKYHPHHLDTWQFTTLRFGRNFLPRATELWNGLTVAVFPGRYDMGIYKKRVESGDSSTLKAGNAPVVPLVLHGFVYGLDHFPSYARLPCKINK